MPGVRINLNYGGQLRSLVLALCAMLAACGGGGGGAEAAGGGGGGGGSGGGGPVAGADYFPLAVGDRWTYSEAGSTTSVRVTGTRVAGGTTALVVHVDEPGDSFEELFSKSASGVHAVPPEAADALERALATVPILKLPIVAGESFVPLDRTLANYADFDGDGRLESLALRAEVTVVGFETLTTAAGTLRDVAHTRTVLRQSTTLSSNGQQVIVTITSDDWYAPELGPVRNVTTVVGGGSSGTEANLVAYRVGNRRSESVAPTVLTRSPPDASVGTSATVRVRFSEPMDRRAGGTYGFALRGPDGLAVSGQVVWADDTSFDFVPAGTLGSGSYTAELATVAEDLAGNALAQSQSWAFSVDAKGPTPLSTTPAADAIEVALNSTIRIVFDEDLDSATVDARAFGLSALDGIGVPISIGLEGRTVTLTPLAPLQRSTGYQVSVGPLLKDRLGNSSPGYSLRFRSDPGQFAAPVTPPSLGSLVQAVAIGDFNGDGRNDMAVIGDGSGSGSGDRQLRLLLQQADGSLGAASVVAAGTCGPSTMQAADLNGDGKTDLVAGGGCGLVMMLQTTSGTLAATVLSPSYADVRAVLPLAADGGRPALLVQSGDQKLVLWRQSVPGVFTGPIAMAPAMNNTNNASIADFDGDGRIDIALAGLLASDNGSGLAVLYQNADGSFGGLREWQNTLPRPPTYVAAGDINNDGRPDLVFVTDGNSPTYIGYLLQQSDGGFGAVATLPTYDLPTQIRVVDVSGDGRADVLVGHRGWHALGLYRQDSSGLQSEVRYEAPYGCSSADSLAVGDLSGDGLADLAYCGAVLRQRPQPASAAASRLRQHGALSGRASSTANGRR